MTESARDARTLTVLLHDRRVILGVVVVALAPAFIVTQSIVNRYHAQRHDLAIEWSSRGEQDLLRNPADAVADFRAALSYSSDRPEDRLRLSQALIAANRPVEARAHLLTLWAEEPGNGPINFALARLAAADGDVAGAVRYYHAAIDGAWESGAAAARRSARLELARLLLSKGQNIRAQAELIALIDDLPGDPALITDVGNLLIEAGADGRAMVLLQRALEIAPENARAARLAGQIQFRLGDFALAHGYLLTAAKSGVLDQDDQMKLDISGKVPDA